MAMIAVQISTENFYEHARLPGSMLHQRCANKHGMDILNFEEDHQDPDPEQQSWEGWFAEDDVKGGALSPSLVHDARKRELRYLQDRKVYQYATVADAIRCTGRRPSASNGSTRTKATPNRPMFDPGWYAPRCAQRE